MELIGTASNVEVYAVLALVLRITVIPVYLKEK